jgi:outer membrane lipoprotein LolB
VRLTAPTRRRTQRALSALAALLLVTACAPLPVREGLASVSRVVQPAFLIEGRLSATDGRDAASGRFEWAHAPAHDRLTLFSPLGQIVARLDGDPSGASLLSADGSRRDAADVDTLLPAVLGIELPAARLPRWVQGAPDTDAEVRAADEAGRPLLIIDQGWRIDYLGYADHTAAALPQRLDISRGDARVRLISDSWSALP